MRFIVPTDTPLSKKFTVPVGKLVFNVFATTVAVKASGWPTVAVVGVTFKEMLGVVFIAKLNKAELLALLLISPAYAALIDLVPTLEKDTERFAVPAVSVLTKAAVPKTLLFVVSVKTTLPLGLKPVTVAVRLIVLLGSATPEGRLNLVMVLAFTTEKLMGAEPAGSFFASPL